MADLFGNVKVRTLGLYQPYASLMLHGKIETRWVRRGKKPPFPLGLYFLYATARPYTMEEFMTLSKCYNSYAEGKLNDEPTRSMNGYGLCIAELVELFLFKDIHKHGCFERDTFVDVLVPESYEEDQRGNWHWYDLWCMKFIDVKRIVPVGYSGKQGVGFLPDEIYKSISYQPQPVLHGN